MVLWVDPDRAYPGISLEIGFGAVGGGGTRLGYRVCDSAET